jgi:hypothetical protein
MKENQIAVERLAGKKDSRQLRNKIQILKDETDIEANRLRADCQTLRLETEAEKAIINRDLVKFKSTAAVEIQQLHEDLECKNNLLGFVHSQNESKQRYLEAALQKQKEESDRLRDLLQSQESGTKYGGKVPNTPIPQNDRTIPRIRPTDNTHTAKKSVAEVLSSSNYWCEQG